MTHIQGHWTKFYIKINDNKSLKIKKEFDYWFTFYEIKCILSDSVFAAQYNFITGIDSPCKKTFLEIYFHDHAMNRTMIDNFHALVF